MNLKRANTKSTEYLTKVQKTLGKKFRACIRRIQSLFSARSILNNCYINAADPSSIYTTRKESLQKEPLELINFCLQAACLDAVWLYPKLRKSFRYFDYCREDFPYSANKSEDPRSQKRTDKTRVAELTRLERSFSSLVEELTCKGNLHRYPKDLQRLMKL
ncbi:unnamed protein product [Trifolium pratense]|uniref:Uncharacterized protein n=1 Tax=Trifolium pratense TaxID=57577 RepID=A0ACB0JP66_TRIPR|nr:unnamed protein product [Trifolium pratense]